VVENARCENMSVDTIISMLFEGFSSAAVFAALYFALIVYRKYPHLSKAGWIYIIIGLMFLGTHLFVDMIDTYVYVHEEKVSVTLFGYTDEIRPIYTILDIGENILAIIGLLFLIFGFYRLYRYGKKLDRGRK